MTGARLPKMKKSYHSNAVPADDASTTLVIDPDFSRCTSATLAMQSPSKRRDNDASERCKR
jgi:hypothetical protein